MAQGTPADPIQRSQPLRSHQPALQWPSQGCRSAPRPAHRYGFGVRCYLSFDWNRFDFFLVLCGMGEVIINPHPNPNPNPDPNPNPTLTLRPKLTLTLALTLALTLT